MHADVRQATMGYHTNAMLIDISESEARILANGGEVKGQIVIGGVFFTISIEAHRGA